MHTFKDKNGKEWKVELNIGSARRARDIATADLLSPKVGETVLSLSTNPELLVNTLYAICQPQCEAADPKISDVAFGELFTGEVIQVATKALMDEICLFSQSPGVRQALQEIHTRTTNLIEKQVGVALETIRDGAIEKAVAEAIEKAESKTPGASSTGLPASSESTPTG